MSHNSNVPTGEDYLVKIVSITEKVVTRGVATILTYEVLEGKYRGEQIVDYLSFKHESEYAKKIAYTKLFGIYDALNIDSHHMKMAPYFIIGKTMIIHMDMEQGLNTVSRSGYKPARDWMRSNPSFGTETITRDEMERINKIFNRAVEKTVEKVLEKTGANKEELVIELTPHVQCEYMIIRRHGCSRRVNFSSDDNQEKRMMKMTEAIRELDFASGKINGGK